MNRASQHPLPGYRPALITIQMRGRKNCRSSQHLLCNRATEKKQRVIHQAELAQEQEIGFST